LAKSHNNEFTRTAQMKSCFSFLTLDHKQQFVKTLTINCCGFDPHHFSAFWQVE
jgi:hypothetical protein